MSCLVSSLSSMSLMDLQLNSSITAATTKDRCWSAESVAKELLLDGHLRNHSVQELATNGLQNWLHVPLGPMAHATGTQATSWASSSPSPTGAHSTPTLPPNA